MNNVDGIGVYGNFLHWAMILFFMGSAMMVFVYFWRRGRLDMDEEPKWEMMQTDEEKHERYK